MSKRLLSEYLLIAVFIGYLSVVFYLVFFNVGSTDRAAYFTQEEIRLLPFKSTYQSIQMAQEFYYGPKKTSYYWYLAARNILGNVLLFMPLGLIFPALNRRFRNLKFIIFSAFVLSFTAEVIQYFLVIGVADIDDILYNIVGALVGYLIFVTLERFFEKKLQRDST